MRTTVRLLTEVLQAAGKGDAGEIDTLAAETEDVGGFARDLVDRRVVDADDLLAVLDGQSLASLVEVELLGPDDVVRLHAAQRPILKALGAAPAGDPLAETRSADRPRPVLGPDLRDLAALLDREGRYQILGRLGEGAMGQVLEVLDRRFGRTVAMKLLTAHGAGDKAWAVAKFKEEGRTAGRLEHPNIMPIYDMGKLPDGRLYFTMKRVQGQGLDEMLEGVPLRRLLEIFGKICDAVAYAGARGVVHRDLKPSNVMVGEFGEVLVLDWGIAKVLGGAAPATSAPALAAIGGGGAGRTVVGSVAGTPGYMSPEQAAGRIDEIDHRTDVYSLGAILYEILTGAPPHLGHDAEKVVQRILKKDVVAPHKRAPGRRIAPELSSIAMKAMARQPGRRYRTARELGEDIGRFLENRPIACHVDSLPRRVAKAIKRRPVVGAIGATALFLGTLSAVALGLSRHYQSAEAGNRLAWELEAQEEAQRLATEESIRVLTASAERCRADGQPLVERWREALEHPLAIRPDDWGAVVDAERVPRIDADDLRRLESLLERSRFLAHRVLDRVEGSPEALDLLAWSAYHQALVEIYRARRKDRFLDYPAASSILDEISGRVPAGGRLAGAIRRLVDWLDAGRRVALRVPGARSVEVWRIPGGGDALGGSFAGTGDLRLSAASLSFLDNPGLRREAVEAGLLVATHPLSGDGTAAFDLPVGDYLLIFWSEGHVPTRYPLLVVREIESNRSIGFRLRREGEIPEGYVHVPKAYSMSADTKAWNWTDDFYIATTETTIGQWLEFKNSPEGTDDPTLVPTVYNTRDCSRHGLFEFFGLDRIPGWLDLPIAGVTYAAIERFVRWTGARTSLPVRLPTEAEWERAAGGHDGRAYPWGDTFSPSLAMMKDTRDRTVGVEIYEPVRSMRDGRSIYGCYHMAGNVAELTATEGYGSETHIEKGGHYIDSKSNLRIEKRGNENDEESSDSRGFRLAIDAGR